MASAEALHLGEDFDLGGEGEYCCVFGFEVDEAFAEAGIVGDVVVGVVEILFVTRGAITRDCV